MIPFSSHIQASGWKFSSVVSINTKYTQRHICLFIPQSFVPTAKVARTFPISGPHGDKQEARIRQGFSQAKALAANRMGGGFDTPTCRKEAEHLESPLSPQHQ